MAGSRWIGLLLALTLFVLSPAHDPLGSQGALTIGDYELVSARPVGKKVTELTYRARLRNGGPPLRAATALASSRKLTIVDGTLTFGPVGTGASVVSSDTLSASTTGTDSSTASA